MDREAFVFLYDYLFWADRQVWACVEALSDDDFDQPLDYSVGSVREQVVHTMRVEHWWPMFLATGALEFMQDVDLSTRAAIRAAWDGVEAHVKAYVGGLTPAELARLVKPPFWDADEAAIPVWQALLQVANHSTDHRAQTLAGLHRLGAATVGQDILDFIHGPGEDG